MKKPFDPKKPVQTRDGRKARIICTDRQSSLTDDLASRLSIIALVDNGHYEGVYSYRSDGSWSSGDLADSHLDLINIPEVKKEFRRVWVESIVRLADYYSGSEELCRRNADSTKKYIGIFVIEKTDGEISDTYFIPWEKK